MNKVHVKTDDLVVVISGDSKDLSTPHKVIAVSPKEGKVIVEKANVVKKHVKPRKQGEAGGITEVEGAIYASKVQLWCPNCKKGVRIKHSIVDGKKVRVCAKCGKEL